jgi:hypothetical protein
VIPSHARQPVLVVVFRLGQSNICIERGAPIHEFAVISQRPTREVLIVQDHVAPNRCGIAASMLVVGQYLKINWMMIVEVGLEEIKTLFLFQLLYKFLPA